MNIQVDVLPVVGVDPELTSVDYVAPPNWASVFGQVESRIDACNMLSDDQSHVYVHPIVHDFVVTSISGTSDLNVAFRLSSSTLVKIADTCGSDEVVKQIGSQIVAHLDSKLPDDQQI